ncbi:MAG: flagellar basal body-associated FliL family protein [Turicibacter sp.]|nr:flagellar basal body-associated FliL family protein [Turicibacter sp.]
MGKSNLMMIIIIFLLVVLLGTVVGVAFFALNTVQNMEAAAAAAAQGFDRSPRQLRPDEIGRFMVGEPIVTNIANEFGSANPVTRIQIVIGYDLTRGQESTDIAQTIEENIIHIRTVALNTIGSRTYQELTASDGMANLSAELLDRLQNDFGTNLIVEISFYEWIITSM